MRKVFTIGIILLLLTGIGILLAPKWYKKNKNYKLRLQDEQLLIKLGDSAIRSLDVPVAALLIYNNEVIGKGFNTANRDLNMWGHAEINAMSETINHIGWDAFGQLDREKLYLVTTFEPCKMCEGAIVENSIRHVVVIKSKPMRNWFKKLQMQLMYQWNRQSTDTDTLQEYMFEKHPGYAKEKVKGNL